MPGENAMTYAILDMEGREAGRVLAVVRANTVRAAFATWIRAEYRGKWDIHVKGREWIRVQERRPEWIKVRETRCPVYLFEGWLPRTKKSLRLDPSGPKYEEETGLIGVRIALDGDPV